MADPDKTTIKTTAFPGIAERTPQSNLTEEQNTALELAKKNAQLEEEKKKSLEYQRTIEQLRECVKQEQEKSAEMAKKMARLEAKVIETVELEAKVKEFAGLEATAGKRAELEVKVKELTEALDKIAAIAAVRKTG